MAQPVPVPATGTGTKPTGFTCGSSGPWSATERDAHMRMSMTRVTMWGIARANGTCIWNRRCEGEGEGEEGDEATALTVHVLCRRRRRRVPWRALRG